MRHHLLPLLLPILAAPALSQATTHFVWVLDQGPVGGAPVIRVLGPDGAQVATVGLPGSGQARALTFAPGGSCYVCRGNQVRVLDRFGNPTGVVLSPPPGTGNAQDVLARAPDQIWVSWGASQSASRLCRYDETGALLATFGPGPMDHPRRIAAPPGAVPDRIFVASSAGQMVHVFDTTPGSEGFTLATDLAPSQVIPVGLAYDTTRSALWVAGDWGASKIIGLFDDGPFPATLSTVLNYGLGTVSGLDAPAGLVFDRFRRLHVAGRSSGGGTAGVYVFDAATGTTITHHTTWPSAGTAPSSVIDVKLQPTPVEICGPRDAAGNIIIQGGAVNTYRFSAPDFPGAVYVAALSLPWAQFDPVFVPGILEPAFTLPAPDARGLPWSCDAIFQGTAGVPFLGAPPPLPPGSPCPGFPPPLDVTMFVLVGGFVGMLDAAGEANAQMAWNTLDPLGAATPPGTELSLSFLTVDPAAASLFGLIATPVPVFFSPAVPATTCP